MIKIALTGGIGCGKSTVCNFFTQLNVPVIDTDIISRELVQAHQPALIEIVDYFGSDILLTDGSLNRKLLANKIFKHEQHRQHLESILHPKIRQSVKEKLSTLNCCYAIVAIPLLLETHQQNHYERVLLIDCSEQLQISRTHDRDQRNLNEIKAIIKSQASRQDRIAIADDIIDNSKSLSILESQIKKLHSMYLELCMNQSPT